MPANPDERATIAGLLERFGEPYEASPNGVAVQLDGGEPELANVDPRSSTPRASTVTNLQLHAPTLDDVFLAKTGRTLEGAAAEEEQAEAEPLERVPA